MTAIRRFNVLSVGVIAGILYAILGLVFGFIYAIISTAVMAVVGVGSVNPGLGSLGNGLVTS